MRISDWSSDVCSSDLAILTELVEAEGAKAARAGFDSLGPSSLDFALLVDVPGRAWSIAHPIRDRLLVALLKRFAAKVIAIPHPTQKAFATGPDNPMTMPSPKEKPSTRVIPQTNKKTSKTK